MNETRHKSGKAGPLTSYDLVASDELTEPMEIWPCVTCEQWHVEVHRLDGDGRVVVREWHEAECAHLRCLLADDAAAE